MPTRQTRQTLAPLGSLTLALTLVGTLTGCPNNTEVTVTDPGSTTAATTTGDATSTPTTTTPTTTVDTTTGDSTTTAATTAESSTGEPGSSTGTVETVACTDLVTAETCIADAACKWSGIIGFTYSAQGCQGSIISFCVDNMPAGGASAWYRDVDGEPQVVEFGYTPTDLDPEWKPCDCDGPLACLCTSVTEDCPARQDEFCGVNINDTGCNNAVFKGNPICAWLLISPEGPLDDTCEVKQKNYDCVPAMDAGTDTCEKSDLPPYPNCNPGNNPQDPVYWRDNEGTIEVVQICGPVPVGWTRCDPVDTPEQPDECSCLCV